MSAKDVRNANAKDVEDANADESKDVRNMTDEKLDTTAADTANTADATDTANTTDTDTTAEDTTPTGTADSPADADAEDEAPQIEFSVTFDDDPADVFSSVPTESDENVASAGPETSVPTESDAKMGMHGTTTSVPTGTDENAASAGAETSVPTESDAEDAEDAEGSGANARRVNETMALAGDEIHIGARIGAHGDPNELRHAERESDAAVDSQIADRVLVKSYPNFSLNHATTTNRKSGRHVLDDVSMAFYAGSLYAVRVLPDEDDPEERVTLMEVLGGFRNPTSGSAMTKSSNLVELEINELRGHRLGIVPQRFAVRGDLDAESNVLYAMNASGRTYLKPKPIAAREFLARVGFGEATSGRKVRDLPLVEQRRVAIARAISCESDVLILDEPTKGLEASDAKAILDLLLSIAHSRDPKRAVIVVTSDSEVTSRADETYSLDD